MSGGPVTMTGPEFIAARLLWPHARWIGSCLSRFGRTNHSTRMHRHPDPPDARDAPPHTDTAERRGAARTRVSEPATVEVRGQDETPVRLLEVSVRGARIQLEPGVTLDAEVIALIIPFTRDPAEAERFVARVVRRSGSVLGLQWLEAPSFDARFKIARLMERERGAPTVLIGALPMLLWPSARER